MDRTGLNYYVSELVTVAGVFLFSTYILGLYKYGDQVAYHEFYNQISHIAFWDVGEIAVATVSSWEPISWFVLWVGAYLDVDKNLWIAILNTLLVLGLLKLLKKYEVSWFVWPLILTNFYLLVLLTSAERLKIAYIFLTWAMVFEGRMRFLVMGLSVLAHLQSIIFLFGAYLSTLSHPCRRLFLSGSLSKSYITWSVLALSGFGLVGYLFYQPISSKAQAYVYLNLDSHQYFGILLLILLGLIVAREKLMIILSMVPLAFAAEILGSGRVNMIAVSLFLYMMLVQRRLSHPLVITLLVYFSVKSFFYVMNIIQYGDGFADRLWF